jgi:hypothetical protein
VLLPQRVERLRRQIERFFPGRFAEDFAPVGMAAQQRHVFGHAHFADQRLGDAVRAVDVVHAKAALDAQAAFVGGALAALDADDFFIAHLVGDQTAHATKRTHRIDFAVHLLRADVALGHEGAGGAGLHTFAATHAAAAAHRVGQVEHHLRVRAPVRQTDDIVDLQVTASAFAAVALNAGVQIHGHGRVRQIRWHRLALERSQCRAHLHAVVLGPLAQLAMRRFSPVVKPLVTLLGQIGQQHFQHHLLAFNSALAVGAHLHARRGAAAAAGGQGALTSDLDHASAAVAIGRQALLVAQVRDGDAQILGDVENALASRRFNRLAIEGELDGAHGLPPWFTSSPDAG